MTTELAPPSGIIINGSTEAFSEFVELPVLVAKQMATIVRLVKEERYHAAELELAKRDKEPDLLPYARAVRTAENETQNAVHKLVEELRK